jgi:hypothetical protein
LARLGCPWLRWATLSFITSRRARPTPLKRANTAQLGNLADALGDDEAELRQAEARAAFTLIVRCLTMSSRVLCSISTACWSALVIGANRMPGRGIASQEAPRVDRVVLAPLDPRVKPEGRLQA